VLKNLRQHYTTTWAHLKHSVFQNVVQRADEAIVCVASGGRGGEGSRSGEGGRGTGPPRQQAVADGNGAVAGWTDGDGANMRDGYMEEVPVEGHILVQVMEADELDWQVCVCVCVCLCVCVCMCVYIHTYSIYIHVWIYGRGEYRQKAESVSVSVSVCMACDWQGGMPPAKLNPFVVIKCGGRQEVTGRKKRTANPVWSQTFSFSIASVGTDVLELLVCVCVCVCV
jgi:hypothetical protein